MRRLVIFAAAIALFASTAAIASADDHDSAAELSDAQQRKAELLADYMLHDGADEAAKEAAIDEIVELRTGDTIVGWGALFKLLQLEAATGVPLSTLIEADGWGFGRLFKALEQEQRDRLEGTAKNFGQLKKQAKEPKSNQGKKP